MSAFEYRTVWNRLAVGAVFAGMLSASGIALGQSLKETIIGTWRTVAIYNEQGGTKEHLYGDKPVGLTMFDRTGHVIQYLSKPDVPKFASSNRLKGTDQEYRTVVQSIIAGFGTYTIDGDTVTIKWVASSYPNRAGTAEKRTYSVVGDNMDVINPTAASGGTSHQTLVRVK